MIKSILPKVMTVFCLSLFLNNSASSQTSTPQKQNLPSSTPNSSTDLDGYPVPYLLPEGVTSGTQEFTWSVAEHINGLWVIKSKESVDVGSKITSITHISSWLEGTVIGNYSEIAKEGFGLCGCPSVTVRITGQIAITLWGNPVGRTYSNTRLFALEKLTQIVE
ncbi:hypothetical protein [Chitinophaga eiseniae]|uniref:Uncharacterized protein n=1 Tax=Chitinophaga eiseniae TaxID=634771 RepID=A0A847SMZ0_9BACT|nr:hypothetical protein [Chitinophaga eiseniae]NLR78549.1 hypothetical protein [Chitinophaga eiseniae]